MATDLASPDLQAGPAPPEEPPLLVAFVDARERYLFVSESYRDWFGVDPAALTGRAVREVLGEEAYAALEEHIRAALSGRVVSFEMSVRYRDRPRRVGATYTPVHGSDGVAGFVGVVQDHSAARSAEAALRTSEERLRQLAQHVGEVFWVTELAEGGGRLVYVNPAYERVWGRSRASLYEDMPSYLEAVHPADRPAAEAALALQATGQDSDAEYRVVRPDGTVRWVHDRGYVIRDASGRATAVVGVATDITERRLAERKLRRVNTAQQVISGELDTHKVVQAVTDAATEVSGAEFGAFFYNVEDRQGGRYMLYTLAGAPPEAFQKFPMPRATALFGATFRGESIVRVDDVRQDPRFGHNSPYHGMPEGHLPVVSYMAVPVVSRSGTVLGGLFFGHSQAGVFTPMAEDLVKGLAAQAAVSIDNARLFEAQAAAERRLRLLAECGAILARSLELGDTLSTLSRLAVPQMADWAGFDLLEEDGSISRLAAATADPAHEALLRGLADRWPPSLTDGAGVGRVIRTGEPVQEAYPDAEARTAGARDEEHRAALRALPVTSALMVPLRARGRILGCFWLASTDRTRGFGTADLELAAACADRAAMAVDNARLYHDSMAAYEAARQANQLKDEFLATLSHELRTPLNAILGWAHMLRQPDLDEERRERAVETIVRNAEVQTQLISDILDVSRIVTGKFRLDVRAVDMAEVVRAAIDTVRPAAEAKQIEIVPELEEDCTVSGDADRLQQVVWNLLSNSVRFTPAGGRIRVQARRTRRQVELVVRDTGPGIPPQALPHLFERFRQADATSTRQHGGLGLGLAIVRHIVELHGGTVAAANAPTEGAVMTVRLPLRPVEAAADAAPPAVAADPPPVPSAAPPAAAELRDVSVLVVEDQADAREMVATLLESRGARVTAVGTAAEALAALERSLPHVIVSDIEMPGEDGYSLLRRVRARAPERGGLIPATALTAYARGEDRRRALEAGFQSHLAKPIKPADLIATIARLAASARSGQGKG